MHYSDDPVRDAELHMEEQQAWLDSRPKCEYCGEPIQDDEAYEIEGVLVCENCVMDFVRDNCKTLISEVYE